MFAKNIIGFKAITWMIVVVLTAVSLGMTVASADPCTVQVTKPDGSTATATHCCGDTDTQTVVSIDVGCKSRGNAILDFTFAIIRFLSAGVGLVVVASMVYAGIQYIGSRGDPSANAQAIKRIQSNVTALLIFVFAYAILNYIIPNGILHP